MAHGTSFMDLILARRSYSILFPSICTSFLDTRSTLSLFFSHLRKVKEDVHCNQYPDT